MSWSWMTRGALTDLCRFDNRVKTPKPVMLSGYYWLIDEEALIVIVTRGHKNDH
jgi:hypothetical protein